MYISIKSLFIYLAVEKNGVEIVHGEATLLAGHRHAVRVVRVDHAPVRVCVCVAVGSELGDEK